MSIQCTEQPEAHLLSYDEISRLPAGKVIWEEYLYRSEEPEDSSLFPAMKTNSNTLVSEYGEESIAA